MRALLFLIFASVTVAMRGVDAGLSSGGQTNQIVEINADDPRIPKRYKPDWKDLDQRPLPEWYDKAKIGIFVHWGVFSVPSFHSEWFWTYWKEPKEDIVNFMKNNYPPGFTYQEFAPMLTGEFFNPREWASLFAEAGAKYVVLTSKHHEGFAMFPSSRSFSWNSVDIGPHRDVVAELGKAVKDIGLEFGLYHSLFEWFNPMYLEDKKNKFTTYTYRDHKLWPDVKQLINDYKPSIFWSDGDWEATDTYWNSTLLLSWLYNDSPVKDHIVVNDRWGSGIPCHHGDFYNCADRYNPGILQDHKWENAFTLDKLSWGYRRDMNITSVMTTEELLLTLVQTVSCGGNVLINVGPTKEGTIPVIFQERLLELGAWLKYNGEAIYETSPWTHQSDSFNNNVWYTCKKTQYHGRHPTDIPMPSDTVTAIYAVFIGWPMDSVLKIKDIATDLQKKKFQVLLLGKKQANLKWNIIDDVVNIHLPSKTAVDSERAWVLKFTRKT